MKMLTAASVMLHGSLFYSIQYQHRLVVNPNTLWTLLSPNSIRQTVYVCKCMLLWTPVNFVKKLHPVKLHTGPARAEGDTFPSR